jgi:hypothetical protein
MASNSELTADELKRRLKEFAERLNKSSVSLLEFTRESGVSIKRVLKHFDTWNDFVCAAGLQPHDRSRLEETDLFPAMRDAFIKARGICGRDKFRRYCDHSPDTYKRRCRGQWRTVLARFREWVLTHDPAFPYLEKLPPLPRPSDSLPAQEVVQEVHRRSPEWNSKGGRRLGPILNFRGLQHAPINEQGVVFLFGMVAVELGYMVESVATAYPDCEAKRLVGKDTWERVQIEFEYRSRNFLTPHCHDSTLCDVIVCWEHNWPECHLEVLELQSAIKTLPSSR